MLYFDGIDVSECIDGNKTSISKECVICHYYPGERAIQIFPIFARRHWLKITS